MATLGLVSSEICCRTQWLPMVTATVGTGKRPYTHTTTLNIYAVFNAVYIYIYIYIYHISYKYIHYVLLPFSVLMLALYSLPMCLLN